MCNLDCVKLVTVLQHSKVEFSNNVLPTAMNESSASMG